MINLIFNWSCFAGRNTEEIRDIEDSIKGALDQMNCKSCSCYSLTININLDATLNNKINGTVLCSCGANLWSIEGHGKCWTLTSINNGGTRPGLS